MGSKNLKAITILGSSKVEVAKPHELRELLREEIKALRQTTRDHTKLMLDEYYAARCWDLNGFVTKGTLKRLDIP